ncbi:MAG TPA: FHA domain-containing protein, partial [Gemmatimonadaceae bacterium]
MPVIKFNGQQFALQPGPNRLGGGTTADVMVGGTEIQAIVDLGKDNKAIIRKSGETSVVKVNGTLLGGPTPLIHGDKVEIAGQELLFAEDAKVGATQFVSAADVAAIAASKRSGPARGTASTGGRLVSLVDGKEYAVPEAGVVIGRDASADIVVAQTSVSRRHAQVIPGANGYVVNDLSTNGLFVNGEKVNGSQPLSRADVIQVGTEQFRFYADTAKAGATPAAAAPAPAAA